MSKVKLPKNEQLPFAQLIAITNLTLNQSRSLYECCKTKPYNLQELVAIGNDLLEEDGINLISNVQDWLTVAKKTMDETNSHFQFWQTNKLNYTY